MTPEYAISLGQETLKIALMVGCPLLLAGMAVGLIVAIFQAATQINEGSLTFVPKILASVAALLLMGPWMLTTLVNFLQRMIHLMPQLLQ